MPVEKFTTEGIYLNNEEMSLVLRCMESIERSAPSDSYVHVIIAKQRTELAGTVKIRSFAGTFDTRVYARDLGGLLETLKVEAHEKIRAWMESRF